MATTIKISTYLWVTCIFVLLANLAVMITLYLYQIPLLKKLSHPLIISIFLAETLKLVSYASLYQDSRLENTKEMLVTLIIFCWVVLDIFCPIPKETVMKRITKRTKEITMRMKIMTLLQKKLI